MSQTKELLTLDEVAERLRVSVNTLKKYVSTGVIPVIRLSPRTFRFDWDAVLAALDRIGGQEADA